MKFADIKAIKVENIAEAKEYFAVPRTERMDLPLYRTDFKVEHDVPMFKVNGSYLPMTRYAFRGLCRELRVPMPVKFAVKIPPSTLDFNIHELKDINKEVSVFIRKEQECILYIRPSPYRPLRNVDIIDLYNETIQQKALAKINLTDISFEVEVRENEGEEILSGDPYHLAIKIFNSEVGIKGAYAQVGLLRSICWNSALISESIRSCYDYQRSYEYNLKNFREKITQIKYEGDVFTKLRSSTHKKLTDEEIAKTWRTLGRILSAWHADHIIRIEPEKRKQLLTRVTERHRRRSIHFGEPGVETEFNAYELGNRITTYARDIDDFLLRNHLESLGGNVLLLN